jgi:hypothetical protein
MMKRIIFSLITVALCLGIFSGRSPRKPKTECLVGPQKCTRKPVTPPGSASGFDFSPIKMFDFSI